jgi:choline dehydrogenase-like flavoprotein
MRGAALEADDELCDVSGGTPHVPAHRSMFYVVGSGPAGIACAKALLDRGAEVTVIDVGRQCESHVLDRVARLQSIDPTRWEPALVEGIKSPVFPERVSSQSLKLVYGSAFPYAFNDSDIGSQDGTSCVQSLAQGGLSNVWGAAVLPYAASDLAGWPLTAEDFHDHYTAVARMMPIAGTRDDLEKTFPFYGEPLPGPRPSHQTERLESRLRRHRASLAARGITFGRSRLALRTTVGPYGNGCQYVGLCLTGCPYFAIYNAADSLREMRAHPRFRYEALCKVEAVAEPDGTAVMLLGRRMDTGQKFRFTGQRAFLAAGVISTTRIILRSLGYYDRQVTLRYHPYFLLPLVTFRNVPGVASERLHTLAQLFLEIQDPRISDRRVHLQLYTYNNAIRDRLRGVLAMVPGLSTRLEGLLLGRLLAIQGYLHGSEEAAIEARLHRGPVPSNDKLDLSGALSSATRRRIRAVCWKLARSAKALGALPVPWMLHIGRPGEGNHIGSAFPMRAEPGPLQTDLLGRLPDFRRVHIVDASVLPSLPATTITYGSMANAHRIGAAATLLEQERR